MDGKAQRAGWRGGTGGMTQGQREEPPGSPRGGGAAGRTGRRAGAAGPRQGGARARQSPAAAWEPGLGKERARPRVGPVLSPNCSAGEMRSVPTGPHFSQGAQHRRLHGPLDRQRGAPWNVSASPNLEPGSQLFQDF